MAAAEAAAEALATAVERWPADGLPPTPAPADYRHPQGHRPDPARNKRDDRHKEAQMVYNDDPPVPRRHRRQPTPAHPDRDVGACYETMLGNSLLY
jgi:predicted RNA polymerase sigma factor